MEQLLIERNILKKCICDVKELIVPEGVKKIEEKAFWNDEHGYDMKNVESVLLPESVANLSKSFSGLRSLKRINVPCSVKKLNSYEFDYCTDLEEVTLTDSLESIGTLSFHMCTSLKKINIPDSVTSIGKEAFAGCVRLENIKLSSGIKKINESMFDSCSSLESIVIPDGVEIIDKYAFMNCNHLKRIVLPETITKIGEQAFGRCNSLIEIECNEQVFEVLWKSYNDSWLEERFKHCVRLLKNNKELRDVEKRYVLRHQQDMIDYFEREGIDLPEILKKGKKE